jgi:dienelactone hydrolase
MSLYYPQNSNVSVLLNKKSTHHSPEQREKSRSPMIQTLDRGPTEVNKMNSHRLQAAYALVVLGSIFSLLLPTLSHAQFPLPQDVQIVAPGLKVPAQAAAFSGVWAGGAWDGILPHVLIVENITDAGDASVIYSFSDASDWNVKASFSRVQGRIDNGRLMFTLRNGEAHVEYIIGEGGDLKGTYTRGKGVSKVSLTKTNLEEIGSPPSTAVIALNEETLRIPVKYQGFFGGSTELQLEATLYRPNQTERFSVVVFNHGSTGPNQIPIDQTQKYSIVARYFVEKGFAFLVPMRRGRGKSEGPYQEGGEGYRCGNETRGINAAIEDLDGVFIFLREQPWADASNVLIGGVSRGGILSVVYAGQRPDTVKGVINFVGGWMGEGCSRDSNGWFFAEAAQKAVVPMIWLYAENDSYYSTTAIKSYRASFEKAGGKGPFHIFKDIGGNGHSLWSKPLIWRPALDEYLNQLNLSTEKNS